MEGDLASVKRCCDPGEDRIACLFGLYHLTCRNTIWMNSMIGILFLNIVLYQSPLRYTIQLEFNRAAAKESKIGRFQPVFDLFDLPQDSDDESANPGKVAMQGFLHALGLQFYDQPTIEKARAQAEEKFRNYIAFYEPPSDVVGGALAAASFFAAHMQHSTASRLEAVNALVASELARSDLQRSHDSLQQQANRQQNYAADLTRANAVLERENQKLQQQIADLQADKMDLQRQVHDLLDLFDAEDGEEADQTPISFPADLSPCTVLLYGGTPGFQTELRKLLPDLRVMEDSKRIDKSALGKADIVFIAVTHFGHSQFDSIMNVCRPNHITTKPIHTTSAKGAAVRIVKEVQVLQITKALDRGQQ